ncbi:hypothetical protein LG272_04880 [Pseudidiomarina marina]|uniref:hypothetical protein n=1 Tax=Pseudidiomarina marina TaxID=502366 RepID=UPI0038511AE1
MSNSGAKAALKGYRLQTLYILNEILLSKGSELIFQPEGNEDLAVYQGEKLVRAVQIKAYSDPLVLSNFIEADKKDTFIHRACKLLNADEPPKVEVISFGKIGNQIASAWSASDKNKETNQNKIRQRLENLKISCSSIDILFKKLVWLPATEDELHQNISKCLSQTMISGSIEHAFSLLTSWLYEAAEKKTRITRAVLLEKINSIGRYFAEREAHHQEWLKSIVPLEENNVFEKRELEKEFYQGISARFSHIQANLDILRHDHLIEIENRFKTSQTVIVHGASGQGKTSLAYRYLYQYVPETWRIQINFIENRTHAENIALAIADHLAVFGATLYLYIDVTPRDSDWTTLVKALLEKPNIKILVTIREEDLARQNISNVQLGFPALVQLKFSQEEAKNIYHNLRAKGVANAYPSFEQAWLGFGGSGSLLEYIFFLTQTESLKERLRFQVKRLRAEVREGKLEASAIKLLLASAVATSYEARVNIPSLVKTIQLKDPQGTFSLFEDEYLIRRSDDNTHLVALHPIRSKLLSDILVDPALSPWIDAALCVVPSIREADLETFLLYSFVEKPNEFQDLFESLKTLDIKTWGAVAGIGRALIWFGIRSHVLENKDVINSARSLVGNDGWSLLLHTDIGGAMGTNPVEDLINLLGTENPLETRSALELRQQISSPQIVYKYISEWLVNLPQELAIPNNSSNWSGLGEVLLWMGRLGVTNKVDLSWLQNLDIETAFKDIEPLADLTIGIFYFSPDLYHSFIDKNKLAVVTLFQKTTQTVWFDHQPKNPIAHYIIPKDHLNSANYTGSDLNKMSCNKATILKKLFPDQEKYGTQGYGHKNILIELPIDESQKNIIHSAIPLPQFVNVNSTWANYADYIFRPNDWQEYAKNILSIREQIVLGLTILNRTLTNYFRKQKSQALIGVGKIDPEYWENLAKINWQLTKLPKLAVDPWGITSECTLNDKNESTNITTNFLSMQDGLKKFRELLNDYIYSMSKFFSQSHFILIFNGLIGRLPKEKHVEYHRKAEELGHPYSERNIHLSCVNFNNSQKNLERFQDEFRAIFHEIISAQDLNEIDKKEKDKINKAWALWYQFAHHPDKYWRESPDIRASAICTSLKNELINAIAQSLNELPDPSMRASILSEDYEYEGKKSLWIEVSTSETAAIDNAFINTVEALTKAIRPVDYKNLKYFVLTTLWDDFVIVPTKNGQTISNISWVISANSFVGDEPVLSEEKAFLYLPNPISSNSLTHFKFKENGSTSYKVLKELEEEISDTFAIVNHMYCFKTLPQNANEVGIKVLENYCNTLIEPLTEHIKAAEKLINKAREYDGDVADTWSKTLDVCQQAIQPFEEPENNLIHISLYDCMEWAEILCGALSQLHFLKNECVSSLR